MKIDKTQYDSVLSPAAALAVAVESDNDKDYSYHYSRLELLCEQARKATRPIILCWNRLATLPSLMKKQSTYTKKHLTLQKNSIYRIATLLYSLR